MNGPPSHILPYLRLKYIIFPSFVKRFRKLSIHTVLNGGKFRFVEIIFFLNYFKKNPRLRTVVRGEGIGCGIPAAAPPRKVKNAFEDESDYFARTPGSRVPLNGRLATVGT
jgi:hypothetical protein